jgi:hypothetical protein
MANHALPDWLATTRFRRDYVEAHGVTPNRLIEREEDDSSIRGGIH